MRDVWIELIAKWGRCDECGRVFSIGVERMFWNPATGAKRCRDCHRADAAPAPPVGIRRRCEAFSPAAGRGVVYVDGGCHGNGQLDVSQRVMVAVVAADDGTVLVEQTDAGGSNNIAELTAVVLAMEWAADHGLTALTAITDSKNNFSWTSGRPPGEGITDRAAVLALQARLAAARQRVTLELHWQPRTANKAGHYIEGTYGL